MTNFLLADYPADTVYDIRFAAAIRSNDTGDIIVEIDGSQHAGSERDTAREAILAAEGLHIVRYWNNDVLQQPTAVLEDILAKLAEPLEPLTRRLTP